MNNLVLAEEYVQLVNDRRHEPQAYHSIDKLYKELVYSRQSFTVFNERDNVLGVYNRVNPLPMVMVYDYKRAFSPVCYIRKTDTGIEIYIKRSELQDIEEIIDIVKASMNEMIIKG